MTGFPAFRLDPADWQAHRDNIRYLRTRVFIEEPGIPETRQWDVAGIRIAKCEKILPAGD